jgi:hypothetical protein
VDDNVEVRQYGGDDLQFDAAVIRINPLQRLVAARRAGLQVPAAMNASRT